MIFKGIAPSIRYCDPEYTRFEERLRWNCISARFREFHIQITPQVQAFGLAMKRAVEAIDNLNNRLHAKKEI